MAVPGPGSLTCYHVSPCEVPAIVGADDMSLLCSAAHLSVNNKSHKYEIFSVNLNIEIFYFFTHDNPSLQAPRAEVVLVLSRSRSVTPADRSYDLIDAATYNFINSSRPPKILESPLDSKSLSAGEQSGPFIE